VKYTAIVLIMLLSFNANAEIFQNNGSSSNSYNREKNFISYISDLPSEKGEYYLGEVSKCMDVMTLARRNSAMLSKEEQYVVKELSRDLIEYYNSLNSVINYEIKKDRNVSLENLPKKINKCFSLMRELDRVSQENNQEDFSMKIRGTLIGKSETEKYYKTFHRCVADMSVIATLTDNNEKLERINALGDVLDDIMNILNKNISKEFYNKVNQASKTDLKQTAQSLNSKEVDRKELLEGMNQNVNSCITKLDLFMNNYFKNNKRQ